MTTTIFRAGYGSSSRFYEEAADRLGMPPATYRNGAAGLAIRYAVGRCALGWLLVATTERGVCAIELGDSAEALEQELANRFPRADRRRDPALAAWVDQVAAFVAVPERGLDLPLDVRGTAFQRRVWDALRAIPAGDTASYAEVARRVGQPAAARAVAAACAANPLAVAIPCHRVVRADGGIGGYRWGPERKRALRAREADAGRSERAA